MVYLLCAMIFLAVLCMRNLNLFGNMFTVYLVQKSWRKLNHIKALPMDLLAGWELFQYYIILTRGPVQPGSVLKLLGSTQSKLRRLFRKVDQVVMGMCPPVTLRLMKLTFQVPMTKTVWKNSFIYTNGMALTSLTLSQLGIPLSQVVAKLLILLFQVVEKLLMILSQVVKLLLALCQVVMLPKIICLMEKFLLLL